MKKGLLILFFFILATSCKKEDDGLVGRWQLIELLADPGDGSGTFYPVSSTKTFEFHADGSLTSNGSICHMGSSTDTPSKGTYSLADSTIRSASCVSSDYGSIRFTHSGTELIVRYPCIEPCLAKFRKR